VRGTEHTVEIDVQGSEEENWERLKDLLTKATAGGLCECHREIAHPSDLPLIPLPLPPSLPLLYTPGRLGMRPRHPYLRMPPLYQRRRRSGSAGSKCIVSCSVHSLCLPFHPFLVSITGVLPLVTMSAPRAQGLVNPHSMLEPPYANIIANKAPSLFLNDDGDNNEDEVPMTVDDNRKHDRSSSSSSSVPVATVNPFRQPTAFAAPNPTTSPHPAQHFTSKTKPRRRSTPP
jgi:hypothetical protein